MTRLNDVDFSLHRQSAGLYQRASGSPASDREVPEERSGSRVSTWMIWTRKETPVKRNKAATLPLQSCVTGTTRASRSPFRYTSEVDSRRAAVNLNRFLDCVFDSRRLRTALRVRFRNTSVAVESDKLADLRPAGKLVFSSPRVSPWPSGPVRSSACWLRRRCVALSGLCDSLTCVVCGRAPTVTCFCPFGNLMRMVLLIWCLRARLYAFAVPELGWLGLF